MQLHFSQQLLHKLQILPVIYIYYAHDDPSEQVHIICDVDKVILR